MIIKANQVIELNETFVMNVSNCQQVIAKPN